VIFWNADFFPDVIGFVIRVIHGHVQTFGINPETLRDQLPRKYDRLVFEIIPKAEVAEHLKKGVMARGVSHIVQIIVFAACAHTFLRRGCALVIAMFNACKKVLELYHSRIREHQCWIVSRHQRARGDNLVPLLGEIIQKCRPDVIQALHETGSLAAIYRFQAGLSALPLPVHMSKQPSAIWTHFAAIFISKSPAFRIPARSTLHRTPRNRSFGWSSATIQSLAAAP